PSTETLLPSRRRIKRRSTRIPGSSTPLVDVGTMPGPTPIYHLRKAFDINSNIGGEIITL
ncbi:hypothetical protein M405DRAFT_581126, partial [Rhizopogon salebrosus TDB-379]